MFASHPDASKRNWGTCVDLPHPVSPATNTTSCLATKSTTLLRASQAGNLRLAVTMEAGAVAHSGARLLYSMTAAFDLCRFFTFFKVLRTVPGSGEGFASATLPSLASVSSSGVHGWALKWASNTTEASLARSNLGASSAKATTRCGFQTVRNLSAPLPWDFVFSPNFGAWAWTKRRSSLVSDGGNCSSRFADLQKPSNCFSILMRQVSRPGVKPDMVLRGVRLAWRRRRRTAAAAVLWLRLRQRPVSRTQACRHDWPVQGQVGDGPAMRADGCAVLASSLAKLASVCKGTSKTGQEEFYQVIFYNLV